MRDQIIDHLRSALNNRVQFFIREEDIQLYLANYFLHSELFQNVFIEYHIPRELIPDYPWTDARNIYIDIVLESNNLFYPIEIKYKTKTQVITNNIFGGEHQMILRNHGAQNIGCYDFWKDVRRCELFEATFPFVERGIVLFVTNDETYLNQPLNNDVGYSNFSIHEGRTIAPNSILQWNGNLAIAATRPPIPIQNQIELNWLDFENLEQHKFLVI